MSDQLVPLDSLVSNEDQVAVPGFPALINGRQVVVTAVLERTVVYEVAAGEARQLAKQVDCLVDPRQVEIREAAAGPQAAARQAARRGMEASRRSQRPHKPAA